MNPWLTPELLQHAKRSPFLPAVELQTSVVGEGVSRRDFFRMAGAGAVLAGFPLASQAAMVFENKSATPGQPPVTAPVERPLQLGEISADFWDQPRRLRLRRGTEFADEVYFQDGRVQADGYWRLCAILRDVHQNRMTAMDITALDTLRGVLGYYEAWKWPHPLTATSGFRTEKTNNALGSEGAAKNSMHLYGRAVDMTMQGINPVNLARLAQHLQAGGVGFYPSKNFVHADTGRMRYWKG